MTSEVRYRLLQLSHMDVKQITTLCGGQDVIVEVPESDETRHNELITLALVGGLTMLESAAAYYFGKTRREEVTLSLQEIRPDGTMKMLALKINRLDKEPVNNQIAKALGTVVQETNQKSGN